MAPKKKKKQTTSKKKQTTNNTKSKTSEMARNPRVPIVPACAPPRALIAAMAAAGAQREEVEGEDLRVVRVDGVHSDAWNLYAEWAYSLGEVNPLLLAYFNPPLHVRRTNICPPRASVSDIQDEANSIINHMAPLLIGDFVDGIPALLAPLAPLPAPAGPVNVRHAKVAVTALIQAISNPGPSFPVINDLHVGHYICHVHYTWRGAVVTVPIFRM